MTKISTYSTLLPESSHCDPLREEALLSPYHIFILQISLNFGGNLLECRDQCLYSFFDKFFVEYTSIQDNKVDQVFV